VMHDGQRVTGIVGRSSNGRSVTIRTRVAVLAGSAVGSAALALSSNVPDPEQQQGQHLHLHPGGVVAGVFDPAPGGEAIRGWRGIPQSWECTELLDFAEGSDRRVWITTAFAHPIAPATAISGSGAAHMRSLREDPNLP